MNKKLIYNIKLVRLIISIFMVVTIFLYLFYEKAKMDINLPNQSLVMTMWASLFVFFIGLQYKIEKKQGTIANFLLLFSIMMFIATILGFVT